MNTNDSDQVKNLLDKSGADSEPVDYCYLAFQYRMYLEVALRALDKIGNGVVQAGEASAIAKKAMEDIGAVNLGTVSGGVK